MVEGVYQASIDQKIALYDQIGGDHLGKDLLQKTTSFVGRALSQVFSKNSSNQAVSNLIADIREKPEFGDRYADLAQAKLTALVGHGKPLTGRVAAQVLSEIKLAKSEYLSRQANIGINIDDYVAAQAEEDIKKAFVKEQGGIGIGLMTEKDKESIKGEAKVRLKSRFTENSPSQAQMKDELTAVARERCSVKILDHNMATRIHRHISGKDINDRSALEIKALAGDGNMVVGSRARAMFPDGPPSIDQNRLNAWAKTEVKDILANPRPTANAGLAETIGISKEFMADFNRNGIVVNGTSFGMKGSNSDPKIIDKELQRLVDVLGGPEQAVTVSKLLFQGTQSVPLASYLTVADETTNLSITDAMGKVIEQKRGPDDDSAILTGTSQSIEIKSDRSAVMSLKHNLGDLDQVKYSAEVSITLSALTGDVRVDDVQVAMIFNSSE